MVGARETRDHRSLSSARRSSKREYFYNPAGILSGEIPESDLNPNCFSSPFPSMSHLQLVMSHVLFTTAPAIAREAASGLFLATASSLRNDSTTPAKVSLLFVG